MLLSQTSTVDIDAWKKEQNVALIISCNIEIIHLVITATDEYVIVFGDKTKQKVVFHGLVSKVSAKESMIIVVRFIPASHDSSPLRFSSDTEFDSTS